MADLEGNLGGSYRRQSSEGIVENCTIEALKTPIYENYNILIIVRKYKPTITCANSG